MTETKKATTEDETTGLLWPKTWNGAYLLVLANFILWLGFLFVLTKLFA